MQINFNNFNHEYFYFITHTHTQIIIFLKASNHSFLLFFSFLLSEVPLLFFLYFLFSIFSNFFNNFFFCECDNVSKNTVSGSSPATTRSIRAVKEVVNLFMDILFYFIIVHLYSTYLFIYFLKPRRLFVCVCMQTVIPKQ